MHILTFYNRADKYMLGVLLEGGLELGIFFLMVPKYSPDIITNPNHSVRNQCKLQFLTRIFKN